MSLRHGGHEQIGVAEFRADIPDWNLGAHRRGGMKNGSQTRVLADAEGDDLVRMIVNHRMHVGPRLIDSAMDRALDIDRSAALVDRIAIEIEFDEVVDRHELGATRSREEEPVGPIRMSDADMAVSVDDVFMRQNPVGDDEV